MPHKTPRRHKAMCTLPPRQPTTATGSSTVPCPGFPMRASRSVCHNCMSTVSSSREPSGLPGFSDASVLACHGLWTPADLHTLANPGASVLPSASVKTLGIRNKLISKLYQHFRERDLPYGLRDSLSTLSPSCSPCLPAVLRHGPKTRYGWVASPFPAGTSTPQDTPSFARRDNGLIIEQTLSLRLSALVARRRCAGVVGLHQASGTRPQALTVKPRGSYGRVRPVRCAHLT